LVVCAVLVEIEVVAVDVPISDVVAGVGVMVELLLDEAAVVVVVGAGVEVGKMLQAL